TRSTPASDPDRARDRLIGLLVHRMFERRLDASLDDRQLSDSARVLCRPDETVDILSIDDVAARAATLYRQLQTKAEVAALRAEGEAHYEVPYTVTSRATGEVTRGVFDCLVVRPDRSAVVVELKTGVPRPEHATQASRYREALAALLPDHRAEIRLVY